MPDETAADLLDAVAEHGALTRDYVRAEWTTLGALRAERSPQRPPALLAVLALLTLIFPVLYLGGSPVAAVRLGGAATWQPGGHADCASANVVCITSDSGSLLNITTPGKIYDGQGHKVAGVKVTTDNVTVQNFTLTNCRGWCAWIKGNGNIFQDNDLTQVNWAPDVSDDIDAMRFFGNSIIIRRNKMHDILVGTDEHGAHLDCMQTYATPSAGGGSSHITIESNYCTSPHFHQCVMAEGPNSTDGGGGGGGVSTDWDIVGNYFDCHATAQTVKLDDIHDVRIDWNNFAGTGSVAVAITSLSSNVQIRAHNKLGSGYNRMS